MDGVFKAAALLGTQVTSVARLAAALPGCVAAQLAWSPACAQQHAGATWLQGRVTHARRRPVANEFEYPVAMALIDLADQPPWFAVQQASDHLSLEQARVFASTDGRVLLLTTPHAAGYGQNPISVYYCYSAAGRLAAGIAEVTNTPWGERVTFVFDPAGAVSPKALHVSPFMDMANTWHLKASDPVASPGQLSVSVLVTHPQHGAYFDAHLLLRPCPPEHQGPPETTGGISRLLKFGFMPQRVAFWIYWQAVKLVARGCPIYAKPEPDAFQARVSSDSGSIRASGVGQPYLWRPAQQWPWFL